ncbi:MAG: nucleoside-diphosphate kinase [Candidatus Limnocylindrus sp.]
MKSQRTLVLIKPDGVQRQLVGRVIARFEDRGLKIVGMRLTAVTRDLAERHYAVHKGRPFFASLVDFITSSPVVAIVLDGPNAISVVRSMVGTTKPHESAPGTIRGDFALETGKNLIHASDAEETAAAEIELWFGAGGLVDYERATDTWVLSDEA